MTSPKRSLHPLSWFRFYVHTLDDPQLQNEMSGEQFRRYVNLLSVARRYDGKIPREAAKLTFEMRLTAKEVERTFLEMIAFGRLEDHGEFLAPTGWEQMQYDSDLSTKRVQKHRNKLRNVSETFPETDRPEQTRAEQTREDKSGGAGVEVAAFADELGCITGIASIDTDLIADWLKVWPRDVILFVAHNEARRRRQASQAPPATVKYLEPAIRRQVAEVCSPLFARANAKTEEELAARTNTRQNEHSKPLKKL